MRKISLILLSTLAFALLVNFTNVQAGPAPDPEVQRVGYVVAYTPNQSITIVDKDGNQFTFTLAADLEIVPHDRANQLAPGAYVTVIAPNNSPGGKHIAKKIVIHPQPPNSFPTPTASLVPTEPPTDTVTPAPTEVPTDTPTDTPTSTAPPAETMTATETPTALGAATETETPTTIPVGTETETPTETPTPSSALTSISPDQPTPSLLTNFVDWLNSLFHQLFPAN